MSSFNDWLDLLSLITPAFFFIFSSVKHYCVSYSVAYLVNFWKLEQFSTSDRLFGNSCVLFFCVILMAIQATVFNENENSVIYQTPQEIIR